MLPVNMLVAKEIPLARQIPVRCEFKWAAGFIASGATNVSPLLTETVPLEDAVRTFELGETVPRLEGPARIVIPDPGQWLRLGVHIRLDQPT
jgi:hypothetical protein